ncbi:MAG: TetR/AcrR family transcriptional regulator [Geobacteraceae bacterium]
MITNAENNLADTHSVLHRRNIPTQKRSTETYNLILDTAANLLGEVGINGFNTNLLAEHAGIRIGTIYRYFPNKLAILSALVERWANLMREKLVSVGDLADPTKDWREIICNFIDIYNSTAQVVPGFFAIRRAMQAAPELRTIEKDMVRDISLYIALAVKKRGSVLSKERIMTLIEIVLMAGAAVFDLARLRGRKDVTMKAEILEELKVMTISYLSNYFD